MRKPHLAILGATGAVGQEFITLIEERKFPYESRWKRVCGGRGKTRIF